MIVALCVLSLGLNTGPHAHEARPTLNHATSACGAQAATSARRSLRPAALPTAGSIHPSPTHPATPLAYSNSRAREYQARAARVAVRGFQMFAVTGSVPNAGSASHHTQVGSEHQIPTTVSAALGGPRILLDSTCSVEKR